GAPGPQALQSPAGGSDQAVPFGQGPAPEMPSQAPSSQGTPRFEDNSGIISTYEDMAKDDSFKTRKLPNPKEKKSFFDGLFKKEK
ncbi:MAG TPA: hypothetical protein VK465_12160, partial [Fibrobacteria bacterium]|nr:hypothetical protein [Fibrobacteria bacterium]